MSKATPTQSKVTRLNQAGFTMIANIISFLASLLIAILALRFVFRLFGANDDNGFVNWIYSASRPFVEPFFGIFNQNIDVTTGRFEIATLIAIVVYGVIAALLIGLLSWPGRRTTV